MRNELASFKKGDHVMLRNDLIQRCGPLETCKINRLKNGNRSLVSFRVINIDKNEPFIIDNIETDEFILYELGYSEKFFYTIVSVLHSSFGKMNIAIRHNYRGFTEKSFEKLEHKISNGRIVRFAPPTKNNIQRAMRKYFRFPVSKEFDDYKALIKRCRILTPKVHLYEKKFNSLRKELEESTMIIEKLRQDLIEKGEIDE